MGGASFSAIGIQIGKMSPWSGFFRFADKFRCINNNYNNNSNNITLIITIII